MMKKFIEVECFNCKTIFNKIKGEFRRSERKGMKHFCGLSCSGSHSNKVSPRKGDVSRLQADNRRDKFTSFRWFMRRITYRTKTKPEKYGATDIDLLYLEMLWKEQNGKCPITGMDLIMPKTCDSWKNGESPYNASLDRIDNSKGYIKGNVRYISHMANIARSTFSDDELIKFCQAVSDNIKNKERYK